MRPRREPGKEDDDEEHGVTVRCHVRRLQPDAPGVLVQEVHAECNLQHRSDRRPEREATEVARVTHRIAEDDRLQRQHDERTQLKNRQSRVPAGDEAPQFEGERRKQLEAQKDEQHARAGHPAFGVDPLPARFADHEQNEHADERELDAAERQRVDPRHRLQQSVHQQ